MLAGDEAIVEPAQQDGGGEALCRFGISVFPLLANVSLQYVLDLWAQWWRRRYAYGDVIIVRFAKFGLELHPNKTRLIEFGRYLAPRRRARGLGKPETFDFLRHQPIPVQGQWRVSVVRGHLAYYAAPGNTDAVAAFRTQATRHWYEALRRRSQRTLGSARGAARKAAPTANVPCCPDAD